MRLPKISFSVPTSIASVVLGFGLFFGFIFLFGSQQQLSQPATLFPPTLSFDASSLAAKSALVYDPTNGRVLFDKNAQVTRPLASLTKLLTAQTVLNAKPTSTPVTITSADLKPEGDWGLRPGDVISLANLVKFALVASSNDAMAAAATSLGGSYLKQMDATAKSLGLSNMYFLNSTGLDQNTETSGAYGSAYDVARLTAAFYKQYPEYFELSTQPKISIPDGKRQLTASTTSLALLDIPGFIGAKTGYTDLAGGNLAAAFDIDLNHPLIIVVLGSTEEGRFDDVRALIGAVRASIQTP